ncbi:hypothetical protein [Metabacillus sp. Hm71]|uniref:hypothetical protein n=1 Tax=Metabacillus sp. Hm71 TaxID=3450743 RepID=UPI003F43E451
MSILYSIFEGYKEHREKHPSMKNYSYLPDYDLLYSSDYLNQLYENASTDQKIMLYQHMTYHDVIDKDYEGYFELANKIKKDLKK